MGNSPKLDEWIEKRPDSWVKKVQKGIWTYEQFKEAFKQSMQEIGKEEVLDYITDFQYTRLFDAYKGQGLEIPPEAQAQPQQALTRFESKAIQTKSYTRKGKSIKGYKATRINWTEGQRRFVKNRQTYKSNKKLTQEFNQTFGTNRSKYSIRDLKLRLAKRKK